MAATQYYATGRRKESTARVFLRPGTGAIKVNHRDALQAMRVQRVRHTNRDIVDEAKTHGPAAFGMMAGRTNAAKGVIDLLSGHEIRRQHDRARRAQRCLHRVGIHRGVRIQICSACGCCTQARCLQHSDIIG